MLQRDRDTLRTAFVLILNLILLTGSDDFAHSKKKDAPKLKPDKPVEREMSGASDHSYRVRLKAGQFLRVVAEQNGIDIVLTLLAPDGRKLTEVDSPNGNQGPESLSHVADVKGTYTLRVSSLEKQAPAGRYSIKIAELRAASGQDKAFFSAERAFKEAMELKTQQTAEALGKSIAKYEEALGLWRTAGDRDFQVVALNNLAEVHYSLGDRKKALELFAEGLAIIRASSGPKVAEATVLSNIAAVYQDLGENDKALENYMAALPLRRDAGDKAGEAVTLSNIGVLYGHTGENQKALDYFNQALALVRAIGNRPYEESILNNLAATYQDLGEVQKSLDHYNQAMQIARQLGDRSGESTIVNGLGNLYLTQGDTSKALENYNKSLAMAREVGDRSKEAVGLANVALAYDTAGEKKQALDFYTRALELTRTVVDPRKEAELLSNIGVLYHSIDDNEKAFEYFDQALPLLRSTGDRSGEATTINNIGAIYDRIGEGQKALEYYAQSLAITRDLGERRTEAVILDNIGAVHESLDDHKQALEYHGQSVVIAREVGDKATLATALRNQGIAERALGDNGRAIDHLNQALENARAVGNPRLIGSALNNLGESLLLSGDQQKAIHYYTESLPMWRGAGDSTGEAGTLYGLARAERDLGNLAESRAKIEAALAIVESLRMRYKRHELRTSYFASVQKYYDFYIDLLMRLNRTRRSDGNDALALEASERARARGLLDMLAEASADIRQGVDLRLLERERSLQQQISARAERQMQLAAGKHSQEQLNAAARELDLLTAQLQEVEAQIRSTSPRYAALTQPRPLSLKEIQQKVLDPESLLLEYSLGEERSFLWVASKTTLTTYELPTRADLDKAARELYALMTEPNRIVTKEKRGLRVARAASDDRSLQEAINKLSRMILLPAAAQLGSKRLLIVADGALQYIPFAALTADSARAYRPLIADHEIIGLPSASVLAVLRDELIGRKPASKTLAVLADPVFEATDERIKKPGPNEKRGLQSSTATSQRGLSIAVQKAAFETGVSSAGFVIPRLPGTKQEAETILALAPEAARKRATDFAANKATATSDELGGYRFVHFATHGFLDSLNPQLSGLVLSLVDEQGAPQNGFLRAHEIYNLRLPADLVVLSACQTGLGKVIRGEGVVGLTRGFMYAGAARVAVSLWSVDDEATSSLMARFYSRMLTERLTPAAALRTAQLEMLKQPKWQAPYYWAAFVLQGEWK
ncbi:MAG TPA: tetratricopeptide repeat protein [Blastocatellia bacterium]|nr:tetratricopeptide repeat protein [Blastocatellia bacterium]